MLLRRTDSLPVGKVWLYELKLDGYRAVAFKRNGTVHLRSRNDRDFNRRYPAVVAALAALPDNTVVDGEIVAFDDAGRPSFNALQHGGPSTPLAYYVFDVMVLAGDDLTHEPLQRRRKVLEKQLRRKLREPVRYSPPFDVELPRLLESVKAHGFEGLVAKHRESAYEPGLRSGAWVKMRVNRGQEFVIGGYTRGTRPFDALVLGYYDGDELIYAARTRSGFTTASRAQLFKKFEGLAIDRCPFANLPETKSGRWGEGLTAAKMAEVQWLQPVLVAQIEFLEWTPDNHLRHASFAGLREDKRAADVVRE